MAVNHVARFFIVTRARASYFLNAWVLSTNHRRIAVMYFAFVIVASCAGLMLATLLRIELAYPGVSIMENNAERYLTTASLHAIVMVFYVIIPVLYGGFGNFLLPTQLGVRDVAFPRLNSFMFWVTPSSFVLLLHIFFFDKATSTPLAHVLPSPAEPRGPAFVVRPRPPRPKMQYFSMVYGWRIASRIREASAEGALRPRRPKHFSGRVVEQQLNASRGFFRALVGGYAGIEQLGRVPAAVDRLVAGLPVQNTGRLYANVGYIAATLGLRPRPHTPSALVNPAAARFGPQVGPALRRQSGATSSTLFRPVVPSYRVAPLIRPTFVRVSSWASNQLIAGWAFVTPYSSRLRYTALGKVDIALISVFAAGIGSVFSSVNYVITYRCVSAPQFKNRRELRSFFVDSLLVGSRMMLAANPALLIAIWLLLSDRHLGTSYFDFSGGGDVVLFQHLFWFFGHPEVYIIILPGFGFVNSLMPHFLRKRLSGRLSLQFSMYTIAFMGFAVWGHHMYMVGLANTTRTLYSTMTVMISVPASTKVLHWCVTMVNSAPQWDVSFLFLLAFTYFFTLGGLSGMFSAHIGFDVALHDTFFVIGHFHVMLAGAAASCVFAGFYFYFAAIFGVRYTRVYAYLHFIFYFSGQALTLIPMIWLGYSGMPRRIMDYPAYFGGWHSIISSGHLLSVLGFVFFVVMLLDSFYEGAAPHALNLGVARIGTRFAFYAYERRRVAQGSALTSQLCKATPRGVEVLDTAHVRYVFN